MNVPTDLSVRAELSRHQHAQNDEMTASLAPHAREGVPLIDQLPICFGGVTFRYEGMSHNSHCVLERINSNLPPNKTHMVHFHGKMRLSQSQLVQLMGPSGEGKTTLLKLIG